MGFCNFSCSFFIGRGWNFPLFTYEIKYIEFYIEVVKFYRNSYSRSLYFYFMYVQKAFIRK